MAVVFGGLVILLFAGAAKGCDVPSYNPNDQPKHQPEATGPAMTQGPNELIECTVARVPGDHPNLDTKRYVTFYGCAERKYCPLTLEFFVRDLTTGETVTHDEPASGPEVNYILGYDAGHDVEINVKLKPAKPGSKQGFVYATDGPANKKLQAIDGGWTAQFDFKTAR